MRIRRHKRRQYIEFIVLKLLESQQYPNSIPYYIRYDNRHFTCLTCNNQFIKNTDIIDRRGNVDMGGILHCCPFCFRCHSSDSTFYLCNKNYQRDTINTMISATCDRCDQPIDGEFYHINNLCNKCETGSTFEDAFCFGQKAKNIWRQLCSKSTHSINTVHS